MRRVVIGAALIANTACSTLDQCHERVVGDAYFVGRVNWLTRQATYVRMIYAPLAQRSSVPGPSVVRVGRRTTSLAAASTGQSMSDMFPIAYEHGASRIFVLNCSSAKAEAGVQVTFSGERLALVTAVGIGDGPCDYSMAWEGHEPFSLPIESDQLLQRLPDHGFIKECRSFF